MDFYLSATGETTHEIVIQRSRFICTLKRIDGFDDALSFVKSVKKKYSDATHNCYAFISNAAGTEQRFSDDGEPQGTAGIPVLDVLLKENLTDCAVVVTRYFGGILLGGGGLVRAYSHAASLAVKKSGIVKMCLFSVCKTKLDYTLYGKLPSLIAEYGGSVEDTVFEADVTVTFKIPNNMLDKFIEDYKDLSLGKGVVTVTDEAYSEAL